MKFSIFTVLRRLQIYPGSLLVRLGRQAQSHGTVSVMDIGLPAFAKILRILTSSCFFHEEKPFFVCRMINWDKADALHMLHEPARMSTFRLLAAVDEERARTMAEAGFYYAGNFSFFLSKIF